MMSKPRILLLVANPKRDLPGIVLLAHELCQRGATCLIALYKHRRTEAWALAPDFVLLPVFRPFQQEQAGQFLDAGVQFGLLDTEGVVWTSLDEYRQTLWKDDAIRHAARCVCMWGSMVSEYSVRQGLFTSDQMRVTGCPRFDFYSPELGAVYQDLITPLAQEKRPVVLLNTNFTVRNDELSKMVKTYGYSPEQLDRACANEHKAIEEVAKLATRLSTDFKQLLIAIRPHPEEDEATYLARIPKHDNLVVSKASYIASWILRSVAVIQRSCTTAIEACMSGKLAIAPQWYAPSNYYPLPESVSLPCASYEEIARRLTARLEGNDQLPEALSETIRNVIHDGFYRIDGQAHSRVADLILERLLPGVKPKTQRCIDYLYGTQAPGVSFTRSAGARIRQTLKLHPEWSFRSFGAPGQKGTDPDFNSQDVTDLLSAIGQVKRVGKASLLRVRSAVDAEEYLVPSFRGGALRVGKE